MRRILKITGIVLISLIVVVMVVVGAAMWYLFTPEKLTPIVNNQAKKYLTCETTVEKVEPSFFSTYPFFGVEIVNMCLKEKLTENSAKPDTLVYTKKCLASADVKSFLFGGDIILDPFYLENGFVNFKIDKQNRINLDILKSDGETSQKKDETKSDDSSLGDITLSNIEIKNFKARYVDEPSKMKADIDQLDAVISCKYSKEELEADMKVNLKHLLYETSDSMLMHLDVKNTSLLIKARDKSKDSYKAEVELQIPDISVSMKGDELLKNMNLGTKLPVSFSLTEKKANLKSAHLRFNEHKLFVDGSVKMFDNSDIETDIKYSTNEWNLEKLLALVPKAYSEPLKGLKAKGLAQLSGTVKGLKSDKTLPVIVTNLKYDKGFVKYTDLPTVRNISTSLTAKVDMNKGGKSDLLLHKAFAKVFKSTVDISGNVNDFMNVPDVDIRAKGNFNLKDFQSFIPKEQRLLVNGNIKADVRTKFNQSAIDKKAFHQIYMKGKFDTKDIYVCMNDTIKVNLPSSNIKVELPTHHKLDKNAKLVNLQVEAPLLDMELQPGMNAKTNDLSLSVDINHLVKDVSAPIAACSFKVGKLFAKADTMSVLSNDAKGNFVFAPRLKGKKEIADIKAVINSGDIALANRDENMFDVKNFYANTNLQYDKTQTNAIAQFKPTAELSFTDGNFDLGQDLYGKIPNTSFTLTPDTMNIKKASIVMGNSDFNLSGILSNISKYLEDKALLTGKFDFVSEKTDVSELMDIVSGMGTEDTTQVKKKDETGSAVPAEDDPFMVPKGVDIRLNTNVKHATIDDHTIDNVKGALTVKDGKLILEQMGFTSKAANMQLTAMYTSERKNHLFANIDFHLLNVDIEELIDMVPHVDTLMPMLKTFKGRGEYHLAGEAYLKSNYEVKTSTIRAASAFEAQDLTVIDSETFSTMAKWLQFKKKTENKVDSLSFEMTAFRDEVELFPFLIVMDKYKAVISGKHTLDNFANYHVSLTDCPLPVRLGLDVKGNVDNLSYKLVKCKYKNLYRPNKQGAVEKRTLRLKKMISESLKANVKPIE